VTASDFRDAELARFERSGWRRIDPLVAALPGIDPVEYLHGRPAAWWSEAAEIAADLRETIAVFRFADQVEIGVLFVPPVPVLDTRRPVDVRIRQAQRGDLVEDFADPDLGEGRDLVPAGSSGAFFLTLVGRYGVNAGSYEAVAQAPLERFEVAGVDTRQGMTRQLWGARVLQAGTQFVPDTEADNSVMNDRWTFTLFAGDELDGGRAASGTVLKSRVRFRLGKPDRGIASARVAPAVPLGGSY
jgi:hypothetical protein